MMFLIISLLLNCTVYGFKIVFELSIGMNIMTNILEVLNCIIILAMIAAKFVETLLRNDYDRVEIDINEFVDFTNLQDAIAVTNMFMVVATFFIPFRFFILCSHYNSFKPFAAILNTLFRVLPGVMSTLLLVIICVLLYAVSFFYVFSPYSEAFKTYGRSLLSLMYENYWEDADYSYAM